MSEDLHVVYGLSCSYFTGKLEAYLQAKGIPFRFEEMTRRQFRACGRATGIVQLPCVQTPAGEWLTDTTAILERFESEHPGPRLTPANPATAFCSALFEDLFDEWFWRPALYYRWAFDEDARLMSNQIARTLLRDVPLPLALRRRFILYRQRRVYLDRDGVTAETAPAIETLYLDSLRELDRIFAKRPFLFGDRPCAADFGLFGPFFRHFFCDPTPGALMRKHAPHLTHWVTRLWSLRASDVEAAPELQQLPDDLDFFFQMVGDSYLPYLVANAAAVDSGDTFVHHHAQGVDWRVPTAPYRAECLDALRRRFARLDAQARRVVSARLPATAVDALDAATTDRPVHKEAKRLVGRLGRPVAVFD